MFPNGSEEPDGKKKRKKRNYKQRDPNAPKRPLTAYFRYLGENRGAIQQEIQSNPDLYQTPGKPGDISRIATDRWNALSKEQQEPYRKAYQDALKDYEKEVAEYKANGNKVGDTTMIEDTNLDASHVEDEATPAKVTTEKVDDDDDDSSSDSSSSESSDEEEEAPPPPPPQKTPKSAMKKGKQAAAANAVNAPQTFSSLGPVETAAVSASSPSRKRKAGNEEDTATAAARKKRGGRSAGEAASSPPAPTPAPVAPMAAASPEAAPASDASKKKKKDKKRK